MRKIGLAEFVAAAGRGEIEPLRGQELLHGKVRAYGAYVSGEAFVLEFRATSENLKRARAAVSQAGIDIPFPVGSR